MNFVVAFGGKVEKVRYFFFAVFFLAGLAVVLAGLADDFAGLAESLAGLADDFAGAFAAFFLAAAFFTGFDSVALAVAFFVVVDDALDPLLKIEAHPVAYLSFVPTRRIVTLLLPFLKN